MTKSVTGKRFILLMTKERLVPRDEYHLLKNGLWGLDIEAPLTFHGKRVTRTSWTFVKNVICL